MAPTALIYGAGGALGRVVVSAFRKRGWQTIGCDLAKSDAHKSIVIGADVLLSAERQGQHVVQEMHKALPPPSELDAVINVSGGFAFGPITSPDVLVSSDQMLSSSVLASLVAAKVASERLRAGGLLLLPGAAPAVAPTPQMVAYGTAKAAVHHLVRSLAAEGSGLPSATRVVGIAPVTIDTPGNREAMPDADFTKWTPLEEIAEQILSWAAGDGSAPEHGSIYRVETDAGQTRYVAIE
jgi:dihydropteridine reductase